jgi:FdhE protein
VIDNSLRARIAALSVAEPALADAFALRGALIEILEHADITAPALRLPGEYVRDRLAAGIPLLDGIDLPVPPAARTLFEHLAAAMLADSAAREAAEAILTTLRTHHIHVEQLVGEAVVGHSDHLAALAETASIPAPMLETIADLTSRPLLASVAQRLRPALGLAIWERGWCPICGACPLLADREDLAPPAPLSDAQTGKPMSLRCGRCTTAWAWTLPHCPDCQPGRLAALGSLEIEGAGAWTVMGCDTCQSYLKISDSPRSDSLALLLADDLLTWNLDRTALTAGYRHAETLARRLEHGDLGSEDDEDD